MYTHEYIFSKILLLSLSLSLTHSHTHTPRQRVRRAASRVVRCLTCLWLMLRFPCTRRGRARKSTAPPLICLCTSACGTTPRNSKWMKTRHHLRCRYVRVSANWCRLHAHVLCLLYDVHLLCLLRMLLLQLLMRFFRLAAENRDAAPLLKVSFWFCVFLFVQSYD